jgi:hypothetical protein
MDRQTLPPRVYHWSSPGAPARRGGAPFSPDPVLPLPAALLPYQAQRVLASLLAMQVWMRQRGARPAPRFADQSEPLFPSLNVRPFDGETLRVLAVARLRELLAVELERAIRGLELTLSKRQLLDGQRHDLLVAVCRRVGQVYQALQRQLGEEAALAALNEELRLAGK